MTTDAIEGGSETVTFFRIYPGSIAPMRADKAALGIMPTMAYRHCEPMRTASSLGWYIFPPEDIYLRWNGSDVFYRSDSGWELLSQVCSEDFQNYWNENCPSDLKNMMPPLLSILPIKGYVQIWSGLLCGTKEGWSSLIRPLVNLPASHMYRCFEGVVESDRFRPFPLFMNIQLLATDVVINLQKASPLFQLQAVLRQSYGEDAHQFSVKDGLGLQQDGAPALCATDWAEYRRTVRKVDLADQIESGKYTAETRKRNKHDSE